MSQGFVRDYVVDATGETALFINGTKQASTSGTSIDFTGIPSGIKEFKVLFIGVSTSGTSGIRFQIGDSGGIDTSGYLGCASFTGSSQGAVNGTSGMDGQTGADATLRHGVFTFSLLEASSNTWSMTGGWGQSNNAFTMQYSYSKVLTGTLDRVRITSTGGSDTFDAGSINIQYDNPNLAVSTQSAGSTDVFINGTEQVTTSGTSIDFTGIPAGVKEIKVIFAAVGVSGTSIPMIQIGDSAGIDTASYSGTGTQLAGSNANVQNSGGWLISGAGADAVTLSGFVTITLLGAKQWIESGTIARTDAAVSCQSAGAHVLTGTLDRLRITTVGGSDTFDNGSVNIQYDNPALKAGTPTQFGKVIQVVNVQDGDLQSGTTTVPIDDTVPTSSEGNEFMTLAITPTDANSLLRIDVVGIASSSVAGGFMTCALYQDSTVAALALSVLYINTDTGMSGQSFTHIMTAGTTSSTTFKVRMGVEDAATVYFNGSSSGRFWGGALASSIIITEIEV